MFDNRQNQTNYLNVLNNYIIFGKFRFVNQFCQKKFVHKLFLHD